MGSEEHPNRTFFGRVSDALSSMRRKAEPKGLEPSKKASEPPQIVSELLQEPQETTDIKIETVTLGNLIPEQKPTFTDGERAKIQTIFRESDKDQRNYADEIIAISQTFEKYLLDGLRVAKDRKEADVFILGCGEDGAMEAFAMQLAAKRKGVKPNIVLVDKNEQYIKKSEINWGRLAEAGLADEHGVKFFPEQVSSLNFSGLSLENSLLIAIRNIDPIETLPFYFLQRVSLRAFLTMENLHNKGLDGRLLVTTGDHMISEIQGIFRNAIRVLGGNKLALKILYGLYVLNSRGFLESNSKNPFKTGRGHWNDEDVCVVGYKS